MENAMKRYRFFIDNAKLDLKTYQENGVEWCLTEEMKPEKRGGFLADEMGLGKTLMMIGTIYANFQGRTLIVVPVILLKQWHQEILRTTGHKSIIFHGKKKTIDMDAPIVLTTYGNVRNLLGIKWFRVVFDEAHHLRNKKTAVHQNAKLLKSDIFWFVSGTPIQNKMEDFKSLCSILGFPYPMTMDLIQEVIQTKVLKREKKTAGIQLPELTCESIAVKWENENEKIISNCFHGELHFRNTKNKDNEDNDQVWDKKESLLNVYNVTDEDPLSLYLTFSEALNEYYAKTSTLTNILKSRQMCILPSLVKKMLNNLTSVVPGEKMKEWNGVVQDLPKYQSKIQTVVNKLVERNNSSGKLIFCHFREEMDKIKQMLEEKGITDIAIIDGRVTLKQRNIIIQQHPSYLLLQIQTACEGLNLQEHYSEVYFVSPSWNPAIEQQAIARCHRIGQKRKVHVYRFYMEEQSMTVEEWIYIKQRKKLEFYI
jgi:SNF2 family DNA or RNA helicase